ncbi:NAD-dependent dehydratase [Arenicella chitinivorans]|uniref:NAD-dependent dehydratase n=1 Tax=Arenicella chitinivorans TaxID=1329800 RepID=A0A918VTA8_9GAMM|nr:NAD-dependent epimerase/dehydratase family protein [Arenicella chitinivorans]GHA20865.1 NAD-dependent dehydratase [Arenicella chitinivorans]
MQTILGASGQIGTELALALNAHHTDAIRVVSRYPQKINESDSVMSADLLDPSQTSAAIAGSTVVYLTAGLPMDTARWVKQWPLIMQHVIEGCREHRAKLVFFDNTYMYAQTSEPQTEQTRFKPNGAKGRVRAQIANQLLAAMQAGHIEALICRAPEFYGPGKTQSITNATILSPLRAGKPARVFIADNTLRTLIYTPDASRAMALLGNTDHAFNQTWHLPCDDQRLTYQQFIALASDILQRPCDHKVLKAWQLHVMGLFNKSVRGTLELLPRYAHDNIFVSDKFKQRFPEFEITPYRTGLTQTLRNP